MATAEACSGCGQPVAPENVLYTTDARIVCAKCYAIADIVETDKRHAHNIRNAAIASAVGGLFAFFSPLSGFMIVVVAVVTATMISGIYALRSLVGAQPRFAVHITPGDRVLIWFCSLFGIIVSGLVAIAVFGGLTGMLFSR
ncbi:MAG: hypothetical protein ABI867_16815 [Kofleriaceae bacterium]